MLHSEICTEEEREKDRRKRERERKDLRNQPQKMLSHDLCLSVSLFSYSKELFCRSVCNTSFFPPQEVEQFFTGRTVHVPELSSNARWINVPTFLFFPLHILDIVSNMKVLRKKNDSLESSNIKLACQNSLLLWPTRNLHDGYNQVV